MSGASGRVEGSNSRAEEDGVDRFFKEILRVAIEIALKSETQELVDKRRTLWAFASDEELEYFARKTTEAGLFTYKENLRLAREVRSRFQKELMRAGN